MKKSIILSLAILLAFSPFTGTAEAASTSKVLWDGAELSPGQIGRVTIESDTSLFKFDENGKKIDVGILKRGEVYRVYTFKPDLFGGEYGIGNGLYVDALGALKYETPSKEKLALVNKPVKVMWDNAELKPGQIGRVTMLKTGFSIFKMENGEMVPARYVKKGEVFRVYGIMSDDYTTNLVLGDNLYAYYESHRKDGSHRYRQTNLKYETPSKEKLALVNKK